jgi:hypothetical protein
MGTNGLVFTYLSWAAFVVGRRSRFDRRLLRPVPSNWLPTFWRLLEEKSTAATPFSLCLRCLPARISGLALREASGDCWHSWTRLGEAGGGLGGPGDGCWSLLAGLGEPSCKGWHSRAVHCV